MKSSNSHCNIFVTNELVFRHNTELAFQFDLWTLDGVVKRTFRLLYKINESKASESQTPFLEVLFEAAP